MCSNACSLGSVAFQLVSVTRNGDPFQQKMFLNWLNPHPRYIYRNDIGLRVIEIDWSIVQR